MVTWTLRESGGLEMTGGRHQHKTLAGILNVSRVGRPPHMPVAQESCR